MDGYMSGENIFRKLVVKIVSLFIWPPLRAKAYRDARLKRDPYPDVSRNALVLPLLKGAIDTVVLGSSHAHYGFHAEGAVFNLGGMSCDLYHSCELYRWLDANDFKMIKTIILFYDVFSPGFELERTSDAAHHIPYEIFFKIPARYVLLGVDEKTRVVMEARAKYHYRHQHCDTAWRGNGDHHIDMTKRIDLAARVAMHLKHCRRGNRQTEYVEKMLLLAKKRADRFIVVLPPLRADYRSKLTEESSTLFPELFKLVRKESAIELLDYHGSPEFSDDDFIDHDHLNAQGAKKLARIINEYRETPKG